MPTAAPPRPDGGLARLLHDLRYRRDRHRQLLGILIVIVLTILGRPIDQLLPVGALLVVAGIAVRLWASGYVKKDKELATGGPYGFVRHPLYVGNLLISVGFCLACGLWWSWPLMLVFWLLYYPVTIRMEDDKLHRLFGEAWERWRAVTRALVPRLRPYPGGGGGTWSFGYSLRLNGEPLIALFLLLCLLVLWWRSGWWV
jgi:hypothetical protein